MVLQNVAFFCSIISNRGRVGLFWAKCNMNCKKIFQFCKVNFYYNMKKPLCKVAYSFMVYLGWSFWSYFGEMFIFVPPLFVWMNV